MNRYKDPVMESVLDLDLDHGAFQTPVLASRFNAMVVLKVFSAAWCGFVFAVNQYPYEHLGEAFDDKKRPEEPLLFRGQWVQEAFMCAIELGLPATPEIILRLLGDREYFEAQLPIPIESPEWGGASGTEIMRQWWLIPSSEYRQAHCAYFQAVLDDAELGSKLKRLAAIHPNSGNRGFSEERNIHPPNYAELLKER